MGTAWSVASSCTSQSVEQQVFMLARLWPHHLQTVWYGPVLLHVQQQRLLTVLCLSLPLIKEYTVFARSDAVATIYFVAQFCAASIRERLLIKSGVY